MDSNSESAARGPADQRESRRAGRRHSRRSILLAGASGLGVAALTASGVTGALPASAPLQRALGLASSSPATRVGVTRVERVFSAARGREVELVTLLPAKSAPPKLPMVVLLHGRGGKARSAAPTGLLTRLSNVVARGSAPPFGFVAVDGGNNYWHSHTPDDDPMRMLLDELPGWLRERGLGGEDGTPFACAGTSMGGFGAMLYARRRTQRRRPVAAVAATAPALITSWAQMSRRNAFRDAADWASMDPLRNIDALRGIPTGIWCGTEDSFIEGVRRYIAAARPEIGFTGPGKHGDAFNRSVVPSVVGFLARYVPRS